MPNSFLTTLYINYVREFSLKITDKKEIKEFRQSMSNELGSLFTGACSTAIADCTHTLVRMGQSDFNSVEELFDSSAPIYVATLPFSLNGEIPFFSYLILDIESLKTILYTDDMFFNAIGQLNQVHRPSRWRK